MVGSSTTSLLVLGAGAVLGSALTIAIISWRSPKGSSSRKLLGQLANPSLVKNPTYEPFLEPSKTANGEVETTYDNLLALPNLSNNVPVEDFLHDEIVNEQFTRNAQFFGDEGQLKVHRAFVVVVGLGGVGSHAAAMLLRCGVGKLRLIDFDQVSLSSLNRHAVATRADVGMSKAACLQNHFQRIFPECQVEARNQMFDASAQDELLSGSPDYVLDCIDNIDTKVALLAACVKKGLKVLSATGAGARVDPTRIRIADLKESSNDPLSRSVRHRLRREHDIHGGIPVVFSLEKPKVKLLPFKGPNGEDAQPSDYQVVPGFRVRIIPVMGTIPAIFGQVMATYVVTQIASMPVQFEPVVNLDVEHYGILHQRLIEREELQFGSAEAVEVDREEVAYVVRELWRGRSARDQDSSNVGRGMWRSMNNLTLTRWDQSRPPTIDNLVLLTFDEVGNFQPNHATSCSFLSSEFTSGQLPKIVFLFDT
ncbi:hypothetical protein KC19_2G042300 [Ceratodon purpureus]|uniref:THIF-type NAD/FAD binding fold domain-containing protein n=1 Tax=Ceratodon purpureus TaxID=3225 RepID=A0A8T0ITY2_CERPU|nr:hypothetical protein KC19_2G042300 [Ceratodon purpureus]